MKSPCLWCGKTVTHVAYESPYCSVGCQADYKTCDATEWERHKVVMFLRSFKDCGLAQSYADAIERGDHL